MEIQCILQNITNNHSTYKKSQMITRSGKIILTSWRSSNFSKNHAAQTSCKKLFMFHCRGSHWTVIPQRKLTP